MQALCIINENELGIFENMSTQFKFTTSYENIIIEDINFEISSINDFLDYLDFQEIKQYNFLAVSKVNRLFEFINYLSLKIDINFNIYDRNNNCLYGEHNQVPLDLFDEINTQIDLEEIQSNSLTSKQLVENSHYSLYTGLYPKIYQETLIKHIYLEDGQFFESLNQNILDSISINGALYIGNNPVENLPSHIINIDMLDYRGEKEFFIDMNEKEFFIKLEKFSSSGEIDNRFKSKGIYDSSIKNDSINLNRLLVFENGLYLDFRKKILLTTDLSVSLKQLQILFSQYKKSGHNIKIDLFLTLFRLVSSLKSGQVTFITPFSKFNLDFTHDSVKEIKLLGIIDGEKCLLFNFKTSKLYEVNTLFLDFLEADLKESLHSDLFKNKYSQNKYDTTLEEYKEIIKNVG